MSKKSDLPASGGQKPRTADHLAEMLSRGEALRLDKLLALSPDEPLGVIEEPGAPRTIPSNGGAWWKKACALRAEYPGFQADHWVLEGMKFGNTPNPGAPLDGASLFPIT